MLGHHAISELPTSSTFIERLSGAILGRLHTIQSILGKLLTEPSIEGRLTTDP